MKPQLYWEGDLDKERYRLVIDAGEHILERRRGEDAMGYPVWGRAQETYTGNQVVELILKLHKRDKRTGVPQGTTVVLCRDGVERRLNHAKAFNQGADAAPGSTNPWREGPGVGGFAAAFRAGQAWADAYHKHRDNKRAKRVLPNDLQEGVGGSASHVVSDNSNICAPEPTARPSNVQILTPSEKKARAVAIAEERARRPIAEEARELKLCECRKGMTHAEATKLLEDASR